MTFNDNRFDADLKAFANSIGIDIALVTKKLTFDIFRDVVQETPVDTGRAKSNWVLSIGQPSGLRDDKATSPSPKGSMDADTLSRAQIVGQGIDGTQVVYITNNLPYIERLNEGWSKQAPASFVQNAVARNVKPIADVTRT